MDGHTPGNQPLSSAIRCELKACPAFLGAIALLLLATQPSWATTYRWVDEQGAVHYGDSMPARYSGSNHAELDAQGRVVKRVEAARQAARNQQREEEEEEARQRAERDQQRHDNALLMTYGNTADIDRARDRALAQEMSTVDSLMVQLKQATTTDEIGRLNAIIMQHYKVMEAIRSRFDADKMRYIQLTGNR